MFRSTAEKQRPSHVCGWTLEKLLGKVGKGEELTHTQKQQTQGPECSECLHSCSQKLAGAHCHSIPMCKIEIRSRGAVSFRKLEEAGLKREALVEALSHNGIIYPSVPSPPHYILKMHINPSLWTLFV